MKKAILLFAMFAAIGLNAQQTHTINWFVGITDAQASLTIDVGDTVIWNWTDASHSVTSNSGSAENFDSGILSAPNSFSYIFTVVGDNPYHCDVHGSMNGVIEVKNLGVDEKSIRDFTIAPNPASSELFIELPSRVENLKVKVFDITGKLVYSQEIGEVRSSINVSTWGDGIYMLELTNGEASQTKRFIKK